MSANTSIEWTATVHPDGTVTPGRTWNPVRGCSVISPGCHNCYAMKLAHRFSGGNAESGFGPYHGLTKQTKAGPQWTGKVVTVEDALLAPLSWRKPARIFVNSMSDLFHESVPDEFIDKVFAVMALSLRHTFQVLTKRPARMLAYMTSAGLAQRIAVAMCQTPGWDRVPAIDDFGHILWRMDASERPIPAGLSKWPLPNVWLGTSVENQHFADARIPLLLQTPAAVRFISAEPLLGPIAIRNYLISGPDPARCANCDRSHGFTRCPNYGSIAPTDSRQPRCESFERKHFDIGWVIVGGESGPGARPFDIQWARDLVSQCKAASVPVFVKQLGSRCMDACFSHHEWPSGTRAHVGQRMEDPRWIQLSKKGGVPEEWPADLRVREFPR